MKKWWVLLCLLVFLPGCAVTGTVETVDDDWLTPVDAPLGQILLELPASATMEASVGDENGRLYLCDGYDLTVQTMDRGDLDRTCRSLCGLESGRVTMLQMNDADGKRWEWAWTCVGEDGDWVGRAAVIDDGNYHYCVTVMAPAGAAAGLEDEWTALFDSFAVG